MAQSNVAFITGNLRDPNGSLGAWLLPTNLQSQLEQTLASANETMRSARQTLDSAHSTIDNTDTNLTTLATQLDLSLANLADMTSNLNAQVVANTNMLSAISKAVVDTDDLVQGLKRHWLLRSAFKPTKTNAPPSKPVLPPKR